MTIKNFLFLNNLVILLFNFFFFLSSLLGIKKILIRKNKEKIMYSLGKLFIPSSSNKNPIKNTPIQKAIDPLTLSFP